MERHVAEFFYEQVAGTYCGAMAHVPHHPTLFSLCRAMTGSEDPTRAMTKQEFADFLYAMAENLQPHQAP